MAWAPPALAAASLCLRISTDRVKATAAALIIGAVLSNAEHPHFPSSLGLEFPCIPSSELPAADLLAFARGLQSEPGELSSAQLSCLARLLAAKNLTADFGSFPPDLLLFFDPNEVRPGTCREFYSRASRGNLELLPRGSSQRMRLLRGALTCLGVRGSRLEPQQLGSLGALVCDLEPGSIATSGSAVLESLKLCPELTEPQRDALNALLLTAATEYGDPTSWDLQTLQDLGPLVLALNQTTLSLVAEAAREDFRRSIAAAYSSQDRSQRAKSLLLLTALAAASASSHPRLKRSTEGCQSKPITASSIDDYFEYSPEQFDLCLSNDVVIENLKGLLDQPLTSQYFDVVKKKVAQIFPLGIPEEELKCLWSLGELYTDQEKSQWPVTSSDTLSALLSPSGGQCDEESPVQQLLGSYRVLGQFLTGPLLQQIGGEYLCKLQEEQIQQIPAEAIEAAGQLNISSCSQSKKDELYRKAREAFVRSYYCQIRPYLDGASAEDLKNLANAGGAINMDLDTFLALNPEELQKLSVTDVKNLLGKNLPELKEVENETLVKSWVERQSQRELDSVLGIGLEGGLQEPTTTATPASPTTSARVTPTATPTVPTATPTARPSLSTMVPCSTHSPATTSRATSPAVTLLTTLLATSSPSATTPSSSPVPAVTSRATTSTGVGTDPAGTIHSTATTAPNATSTPTATHSIATTVSNATSTPTATHSTATTAPNATSTPTATHSIATTVPNATSTPTATDSIATTVPNATSTPTATHSTATTVPNATSTPTATHSIATTVSNATSTPTATHSTATTAPNATSTPTATHSTATTAPNATSTPTATPNTATTVPNVTSAPIATTVPNPSSAPTATHSTVPSVPNATNSTPAPAATTAPHTTSPPHKPTPIPNSTTPTQNSPSSSSAHPTTLPCPTSSPPAFPGPSPTPSSRETPKATPGKVPVPPPPTSHGYINLQPEAGSGSRLSSCLLPLLAATAGNILLRGLL